MAPGLLSSPHSSRAPVTTHITPADTTPSSDQILLSALQSTPYDFLLPPPSLSTAALVLTKRYLDPLAASTSDTQTARLQAARKKRKRKEAESEGARNLLRLKEIHLEGFGVDQIWEQARRVLDAARKETEQNFTALTLENGPAQKTKLNGAGKDQKSVKFNEEEFDSDISGIGDLSNGENEDDEYSDQDDHNSEDVDIDDLYETQELEDRLDKKERAKGGLEGMEDMESGSDMELDGDGPNGRTEIFVKDRHGLNDGFFSIDDFNRNTEFLERQDAKGDPDDGAASDEEDIDYAVDPKSQISQIAKKRSHTSKQPPGRGGDSSEEDGPTFGDVDLNAPWSDSDNDDAANQTSMRFADEPEDTFTNTNEILYADFFAPPARAKAKTKSTRMRALPKTQPQQPSTLQASATKDGDEEEPVEAVTRRTTAVLQRDLFSDDEEGGADNEFLDEDFSDPEEAAAAAAANDPSLSTHERRQARMVAYIRKLEAAAVGKREWTLQGEARAADRPLNSLLEEDLEFERAGKPVPVITAETSRDIEGIIKRRILERNYDEIIKRVPTVGAVFGGGGAGEQRRRGLVELDDQKDRRGLGEVYEEEHLARTDPNFVDKRDAKLKAAHAEIEKLWREVSGKLDALSSLRYKPAPPEIEVAVVSDAPRITMEDARPAGIGGLGLAVEEGGLAPQEIYKAGEGKQKGDGDVVMKGGAVVAGEEMTRDERKRRRRRNKERSRKQESKEKVAKGDAEGGKHKKKAEERKDVVSQLKKSGVKVIGKRGEITDISGNEVKTAGGMNAGGFKL